MDPQAQADAAAAVLGADPAPLTALLADLVSPANEARSRAERTFHSLRASHPDALALRLAHLLLSPSHPSAPMAAVLVSIYVNPSQFAPTEDLATYPSDLAEDLRKLASTGAVHAVSSSNVLRLYACEDSSLCRARCDDVLGACAGGNKSSGAAAGCCYPLSDGSAWKPGDGLAVFAGFGCRGFASWVKNSSSSSSARVVTRGIEVEWAVPRGSALAACAGGAAPVNATAVRGGVRCACAPGFVGDGFARGTGCYKRLPCDNGGECCQGRFCSKKAVAMAGSAPMRLTSRCDVCGWCNSTID